MGFFDVLKNDRGCEKLTKDLSDFLVKIGKKTEDLDNFISDPETFKKNIMKKYNGNKECFNQILTNLTALSKKLNVPLKTVGKQIGLGIIYSLGDPRHDLEKTISLNTVGASRGNYLQQFDTCAFFSTISIYNNYEKNAEYLGNWFGKKWLMPANDANNLVKKIESKTAVEYRHKLYEDAIGYSPGATNDEPSYVLTIIDGVEIKNAGKEYDWLKFYMPNGTSGGNALWIPGGMTSGGKLEIMVNGIPNKEPFVVSRTCYSFTPGIRPEKLSVKT